MKWVKSGAKCPQCKGNTEYYEHHGKNFKVYFEAERCPRCQWQIKFKPKPRQVEYGSNVPLSVR